MQIAHFISHTVIVKWPVKLAISGNMIGNGLANLHAYKFRMFLYTEAELSMNE